MEEKNNQNNPAGSAADDIIIEEETDNPAETVKKIRAKVKDLRSREGRISGRLAEGKSGFGQRPKGRRRKKEGHHKVFRESAGAGVGQSGRFF